jgi:hypothetical protein
VYLSIDTTLCPLETTDDVFWSVKHKKHGMKYETSIRLLDGLLCHISTGFPGSVFDGSFHKTAPSSVNCSIPRLELRLADKAYVGEENCICPFKNYRRNPLTPAKIGFNNAHLALQAGVEMTNRRLKIWGVLSKPFRDDLDKHNILFKICANLTNIKIKFHLGLLP